MRFTSPNNDRREGGFTLVELLVIAPIAILIIAGFIVLMMSIIGNVMLTHDESKMMYDSNSALNTIEQDARLSVQFMTATTGVVSPQGTGSNFAGAGNFTNSSNTLILKTLATTKNPRDSTRGLVYYANQPDPCGALDSLNHVFAVTVVYFIKDSSLWRRTLVPSHNQSSPVNGSTTCSAPWQLNSCSPGQTASICTTEDVRLVDNVSALSVQYFSEPSSNTPITSSQANNASTIKVTLTSKKTTAGRDTSNTQTLVANKLNDMPANIGPMP